jgi:hypothetical protein
MSRHFITGAAPSVTNSVERVTALRKAHPEWNETLSPNAAARERLAKSTKPPSAPRVCGLDDWLMGRRASRGFEALPCELRAMAQRRGRNGALAARCERRAQAWPVSRRVNSSRAPGDDSTLIEPIEASAAAA